MDRFIIENSGKCIDCGENKTLDSMIRKDGKKGVYHCIDCETIEMAQYFERKDYQNIEHINECNNKIKKLLAWCFG